MFVVVLVVCAPVAKTYFTRQPGYPVIAATGADCRRANASTSITLTQRRFAHAERHGSDTPPRNDEIVELGTPDFVHRGLTAFRGATAQSSAQHRRQYRERCNASHRCYT